MTAFSESVVEEAALDWLKALGYAVLHGPGIAVGELRAVRTNHKQPNYQRFRCEASLA
jgi:type I restriction enzyme R subunit